MFFPQHILWSWRGDWNRCFQILQIGNSSLIKVSPPPFRTHCLAVSGGFQKIFIHLVHHALMNLIWGISRFFSTTCAPPPLTPHKSLFPSHLPCPGWAGQWRKQLSCCRPLSPLCIVCLFMCFLRLVMGMDWWSHRLSHLLCQRGILVWVLGCNNKLSNREKICGGNWRVWKQPRSPSINDGARGERERMVDIAILFKF